ncbi:hypothetical protein HD806DRAFT_551733 [Xylariaceae sp. AK1471]|nr:hypothetical protein HD806DRAFT_551556 [Xylariaceae sp. AK1471]KAI3326661.1 hypothetical protein HD806DRAFT_551733 [Xylariaceae sp. AK1471]
MASTNLSNVYDTILKFGDYYRRRYSLETNPTRSTCATLSAQDIAYYEQIIHCRDLPKAFEDQLDLDLGFYHGVRDQIASISRVWDAVLEEKARYDAEGWPSMDRQFMESFLLCLQIIPAQIKTGYLGPSLLRSASNTSAYPGGLPIIQEEPGKTESQTSSRPMSAFSFGDFPWFGSPMEDFFPSVGAIEKSQQQPASDFQSNAIGHVSVLEQVPVKSEMSDYDMEEGYRNSSFGVSLAKKGQPDSVIWGDGKVATVNPRQLLLGDPASPAGGLEKQDNDIQSPLLKGKTSKPPYRVSKKRKAVEIEDREDNIAATRPAKRQGRPRGRPRRSQTPGP